MLFKVAKYLLAIRVRDLGVNFGVLDVLVAEMVGDIFNPASGFQEVNGNRVAKRMNGSTSDASLFGIVSKKFLYHAFLEGPLAAGEEVGAGVFANPHMRSQGFGRVAPERSLAANTVLEAADADAVVFEVDILNGDCGGFVHTEAVVVDQAEQGPVARGVDRRKEAFEFVLGQIFGEGAHRIV